MLPPTVTVAVILPLASVVIAFIAGDSPEKSSSCAVFNSSISF